MLVVCTTENFVFSPGTKTNVPVDDELPTGQTE